MFFKLNAYVVRFQVDVHETCLMQVWERFEDLSEHVESEADILKTGHSHKLLGREELLKAYAAVLHFKLRELVGNSKTNNFGKAKNFGCCTGKLENSFLNVIELRLFRNRHKMMHDA